MSFTSDSRCDEDEIRMLVPRFEDDDEEVEDSSHHSFAGEASSSSISSSSSRMMRSSVLEDVPHDVKPDVLEEFKPNYLMRFKSVNAATEMYKSYAEKAGFDVRLNTERKDGDLIIHKYLVCHRNGNPAKKSLDMNEERNTTYKATGCKAKTVVKNIKGTLDYKFERFQELHNHDLLDINHLRASRKLSYSDKEFIVRASTAKIGATKAYKIKATLKGGFQQMRGKVVDFKNFSRDMGSKKQLKMRRM